MNKANRARGLRYKRPALDALGYDAICSELCEISEACSEIQWFMDDDGETLLNALDGDEDEEYEFRMAFSDLSAKSEQLWEIVRGEVVRDNFDDCTVGLIGNRYDSIGYDGYEEDYYSLTSFEQELAYTDSGKRVMRMTKPEMLSTIGQCLGIVVAFLDLRHSYDYLKATFDILRDENTSILKVIKGIEIAYESADKTEWDIYNREVKEFDSLVASLPDRLWIE